MYEGCCLQLAIMHGCEKHLICIFWYLFASKTYLSNVLTSLMEHVSMIVAYSGTSSAWKFMLQCRSKVWTCCRGISWGQLQSNLLWWQCKFLTLLVSILKYLQVCWNKVYPTFIHRQAFVASILKPLHQLYWKMLN